MIVSDCEISAQLRSSGAASFDEASLAWFGRDPRRGLCVVGRHGWSVRLADTVFTDLVVIAPLIAERSGVVAHLRAVWSDNADGRARGVPEVPVGDTERATQNDAAHEILDSTYRRIGMFVNRR